MRNAILKTEPSIAFAQPIISATHTVLADPNAYSALIALAIRLVSETSVLILVLVPVVPTVNVASLITFRYAHALKDSPEIHIHHVNPSQQPVRNSN